MTSRPRSIEPKRVRKPVADLGRGEQKIFDPTSLHLELNFGILSKSVAVYSLSIAIAHFIIFAIMKLSRLSEFSNVTLL